MQIQLWYPDFIEIIRKTKGLLSQVRKFQEPSQMQWNIKSGNVIRSTAVQRVHKPVNHFEFPVKPLG